MQEKTIAIFGKNEKSGFDIQERFPNYNRRYKGSEELIYPKDTARAIYVKNIMVINLTITLLSMQLVNLFNYCSTRFRVAILGEDEEDKCC